MEIQVSKDIHRPLRVFGVRGLATPARSNRLCSTVCFDASQVATALALALWTLGVDSPNG